MPDHTMKYENGNPILLLENIKNTMLNFQPTKYPYHTIKTERGACTPTGMTRTCKYLTITNRLKKLASLNIMEVPLVSIGE